jgi:hypothetical protein
VIEFSIELTDILPEALDDAILMDISSEGGVYHCHF